MLVACIVGLALALAQAWIADAWRRLTYQDPVGTRLAKPCIAANICDHIVDHARLVGVGDIGRVNAMFAGILAESDVDIRVVFGSADGANGLDASGDAAAMERLRVGSPTQEQRGVLLQFDTTQRRLRIDVGYGLEGYFPDAFVAYLIDQHSRLFFDAQEGGLALQMLARLLHHRVREAVLGSEFDPRFLAMAAATQYLSGGAGATRGADSGIEVTRPAASDDAGAMFAAGVTPRQTYATYLRLLAEPQWLADSDLFTAESRAYLRQLPLSPAYRHFILMQEYGKAFEVVERGGHAILYFTGTPFVSPHFLVREGDVWRIDIGAELNATTEHVGKPYTWSIKTLEEPAISRFRDLVVDLDGHLRIRGGDNQPLPIRGLGRARR
ncbi:MAG: TPM domain-containing protein [Rubrivivax sp.]